MPKRIPQNWEILERELHVAGVSQAEIEAGARRLLAEARGHQLAEAHNSSALPKRYRRGYGREHRPGVPDRAW
jgi:hypothetical protein